MPSSTARSMTAKAASSSSWVPKIIVPRQSLLTRRPLRPRFTVSIPVAPPLLGRVVVEAAPGLAAELAPLDLLAQRRGRAGPALQAAAVLQGAEEHVEAAEVEHLERPH